MYYQYVYLTDTHGKQFSLHFQLFSVESYSVHHFSMVNFLNMVETSQCALECMFVVYNSDYGQGSPSCCICLYDELHSSTYQSWFLCCK